MPVLLTVIYRGDLRCEAVHEPSGTHLFTDAPVDNRGRGESFSPTDLLAASIGTCMLTIMGIRAAEHGWSIEGSRARLEKHMAAAPRRRISRVEVAIEVPSELDEHARETLVQAALGCPVHASLEGALDVPVRFRFGSIEVQSDAARIAT